MGFLFIADLLQGSHKIIYIERSTNLLFICIPDIAQFVKNNNSTLNLVHESSVKSHEFERNVNQKINVLC